MHRGKEHDGSSKVYFHLRLDDSLARPCAKPSSSALQSTEQVIATNLHESMIPNLANLCTVVRSRIHRRDQSSHNSQCSHNDRSKQLASHC